MATCVVCGGRCWGDSDSGEVRCRLHRFPCVCETCGQTFYTPRRARKTCPDCKVAPVTCADCGVVFSPAMRGVRPEVCAACAKQRAARSSVAARREARLVEYPVAPCVDCGRELPPHTTTRYVRCPECRTAYLQKYEKDRRTRQKAADPQFDRRRDLWRKYRMTLEDFDAMLSAQGGGCAICGSLEPGNKGYWHIDHDHDSGHVRGILCGNCNVGLGYFRDHPEYLNRAIRYLDQKR